MVGGADNAFQVDDILDFKPKPPKTSRSSKVAPRKVRELSFCVRRQGLDWNVDAWQPWEKLKGTCDALLTALASRFGLPGELFLEGSHVLPLQTTTQPVMPLQAILCSAQHRLR